MDVDVRRAIGLRLKESREAMKLTQAAVACELGVNRQAISAWEHGRDMPRAEAWFKIGPLYGTSLDYLVYGVRLVPQSPSPMLAAIFATA
jgi:transcriptional regulator with XRE-family HTH domain